jgi:putative acetyltransferase
MATKVFIRHATLDDMSELEPLITQSIRLTNANDYPPEVIERTCALFAAEKLRETFLRRDVFVAVKGGKIIGTISLGNGKVQNFFVARDSQKQGVGEKLLRHIEAHAKAKGMSELKVSSSITATPYYQKHGYMKLHFEPSMNGSTWAMVKALG